MIKQASLIALAGGCGFLVAVVRPEAPAAVRSLLTRSLGSSADAGRPGRPEPAGETKADAPATSTAPKPISNVRLTDAQIRSVGIETMNVAGGMLNRHLHVPGTIVADANNTAHIAVKTTGTVVELRKKLGDPVRKGEVVALLDSREIADTKGEYLAARVSTALQKTIFERDQALWEKRVAPEMQFLRSQAAYQDIKVKADAARRKLTFLGLSAGEIDNLPNQPAARFERQEIRSPIDGRIVERRVDLGTAVGRDNLETELYSVVDLRQVWVELAMTPGDLPLVREGQTVTISTQATGAKAEGHIIFIGPVLNQSTRAARVITELPNPREDWRPGSFVTATIAVADRAADVLVPAKAIQTIDGKPTVFVRTADGFAPRTVALGRSDDRNVEVTSGIAAGDRIAVANSFVVKAEFEKSLAED